MLFDFYYYFMSKTNNHNFTDKDSCLMAAYITQNGKCFITGRKLQSNFRSIHHRIPIELGGKNTPENLILVDRRIHKMIHTYYRSTFNNIAKKLNLSEEDINKINQLRTEASSCFINNS